MKFLKLILFSFALVSCGKNKETPKPVFRPGAAVGTVIQNSTASAPQAEIQVSYGQDFFERRSLNYSLQNSAFVLQSPLIVSDPVPDKVTLKLTLPQMRGVNLRASLTTYYQGNSRDLSVRIVSQEIVDTKLVVGVDLFNLAQFISREERPSVFHLKVFTNERQEKITLSFRMPPQAMEVTDVSFYTEEGFQSKAIGVNATAILVKKIKVKNHSSEEIRLRWNQSLTAKLYAQFQDISYFQAHSCGSDRRITVFRHKIGSQLILLKESQEENLFSTVSASGESIWGDLIVAAHKEETLNVWAIINPVFTHLYKAKNCNTSVAYLVTGCHQSGCAEWRESGRLVGYRVCIRYHLAPNVPEPHNQSFSFTGIAYELDLAQIDARSFYADSELQSTHQSALQRLLEERHTVFGSVDFNAEIRQLEDAAICQ